MFFYVFIDLRKQIRQKKEGCLYLQVLDHIYLTLGIMGAVCFPSFNNQSIEAWPQDRIEKISSSIDSLNPFEEKRDFFAHRY